MKKKQPKKQQEKQQEIYLTPQENVVLQALREHPKGISTMYLIQLTNITRPNTILWSLRKKGFDIETIPTTNPNTNKRYGTYKLIKEPGEKIDG